MTPHPMGQFVSSRVHVRDLFSQTRRRGDGAKIDVEAMAQKYYLEGLVIVFQSVAPCHQRPSSTDSTQSGLNSGSQPVGFLLRVGTDERSSSFLLINLVFFFHRHTRCTQLRRATSREHRDLTAWRCLVNLFGNTMKLARAVVEPAGLRGPPFATNSQVFVRARSW